MTALDLLLRPELLAAARQYFAGQTKETQWKSLIPEGTKAPIDLNREKMERFHPALRKLYYDPRIRADRASASQSAQARAPALNQAPRTSETTAPVGRPMHSFA
jgi:hypothetical protein